MHAITYRPALLSDVAAMATLRDRSGWTGGAGAETMTRYLAGEHHPQQALAPRVALLAEGADGLLGYIAGHHTTRFACEGELQWLLVAPAARGSPVPAGLLAALGAWFVDAGARRICVNVAPENAPARRLYARHGAVPLSEYWMVWADMGAAMGPCAGPPAATR